MKLRLRDKDQVNLLDIETVALEQCRYFREQYSELVIQKTQGPEVTKLFSSLRKGTSPLVDDAIQDLHTASTIIAALGVNSSGGQVGTDVHLEHHILLHGVNHTTGGPLAHIIDHFQVLPGAPGIRTVTSEEVSAVTIILLLDLFLISHRVLPMTDPGVCPFFFSSARKHTRMAKVCEPRIDSLVTGGRAHSLLQTSFSLQPAKPQVGQERVLLCGQRDIKASGTASYQGSTGMPHLCFPSGVCAQSRRKTSPDFGPAVGERIRQYTTFQAIRLNGTKTYCAPRRSVDETRPGERFLARPGSRFKSEVPGVQMEGVVLSVACPPISSGMQPVLFRQVGSGEHEVPGSPYSPTTDATLCRRFSSLRPAQLHSGGYPPGRGDSRIVRVEDKHKQIRSNTNGSDYFPGAQSPVLQGGNLHKGYARKASTIEGRCSTSPSQTNCLCTGYRSHSRSVYCHGKSNNACQALPAVPISPLAQKKLLGGAYDIARRLSARHSSGGTKI